MGKWNPQIRDGGLWLSCQWMNHPSSAHPSSSFTDIICSSFFFHPSIYSPNHPSFLLSIHPPDQTSQPSQPKRSNITHPFIRHLFTLFVYLASIHFITLILSFLYSIAIADIHLSIHTQFLKMEYQGHLTYLFKKYACRSGNKQLNWT